MGCFPPVNGNCRPYICHLFFSKCWHPHSYPMIASSFGSPVQARKYGDGKMDPMSLFRAFKSLFGFESWLLRHVPKEHTWCSNPFLMLRKSYTENLEFEKPNANSLYTYSKVSPLTNAISYPRLDLTLAPLAFTFMYPRIHHNRAHLKHSYTLGTMSVSNHGSWTSNIG